MLKTAAIEKDGINDTVNIDWVSAAQRKNDNPGPSQPHTEDGELVSRVVKHSAVNGRTLDYLRWYEYFPIGDTDESE